MFQTCVKNKPQLLACVGLSLGLAIGLASVSSPAYAQTKGGTTSKASAPTPGTITVSDYEFNTFVFPVPLKRVLFPGGSPVGQPIYLADNTQVMLQFTKGASKPIQMVAELENGSVVTLRLSPRSVPGISHAVNGARVRSGVSGINEPSTGRVVHGVGNEATASPNAADIELLKTIVTRGAAPDSFDPIRLPAPVQFDKFSVVPLSGWSDGERRILVFSLVAAAGQTAVVAPPQFYRPGISAVMLDGDVVDAQNSPQLYVVEELNDE